jgi:hypothetical protein
MAAGKTPRTAQGSLGQSHMGTGCLDHNQKDDATLIANSGPY